jgi:hypothetical protein
VSLKDRLIGRMKDSAASRAADQGRADAAAALARAREQREQPVDLVAAERQVEAEQSIQ